MAIFFPPPPQIVSATGAQPYAQGKLPPSLLNVPLTNPPFTYGGPIVMQAIAVSLAQPDPWIRALELGPAGGEQPYGARKLNASIIAVPENNPPFSLTGGPFAALASIVPQQQPDPWSWNFYGPATGLQPYGPRKFNPGIPGNTNDPPPFNSRARNPAIAAAIVQMAQPDPWIYALQPGPAGGQQPYGPRQLSPGIPGQSVNEPPYDRRSAETQARIVAAAQPDPWVFTILGAVSGRQPYGLRQLNPSITAVPVNNPPFSPRAVALLASITAQTQADPWVYMFYGPAGGLQPYAPRQFNAGIPGNSNDPPPFNLKRTQPNIAAHWVELSGPTQPYKLKVTTRLKFSKGYVIS